MVHRQSTPPPLSDRQRARVVQLVSRWDATCSAEQGVQWVSALLARVLMGRTWADVLAADEHGPELYEVFERWQRSGLIEALNEALLIRLDDVTSDNP